MMRAAFAALALAAAPKGMDPQVVRALHDAFKRTLEDPDHVKVLQQLDQDYWYKSPEEFAQCIGLLAK